TTDLSDTWAARMASTIAAGDTRSVAGGGNGGCEHPASSKANADAPSAAQVRLRVMYCSGRMIAANDARPRQAEAAHRCRDRRTGFRAAANSSDSAPAARIHQ